MCAWRCLERIAICWLARSVDQLLNGLPFLLSQLVHPSDTNETNEDFQPIPSSLAGTAA